MEFSLKKSFKSHGSYKHSHKISACEDDDGIQEDQHPILFEHHQQQYISYINDNRIGEEVIVKVDAAEGEYDSNNGNFLNKMGSSNKTWRESRYGGFWGENDRDSSGGDACISNEFSFQRMGGSGGRGGSNDGGKPVDPPSKLIGQFLEQQKNAGEMSLDMDLEMEELRNDRRSFLPPLPPENASRMSNSQTPNSSSIYNDGSREIRVSFQERAPDHNRRRSMAFNDVGDASSSSSTDEESIDGSKPDGHQSTTASSGRDNAEVLRCTSNRTFQRVPTLSRTKTKSRLIDPPAQLRQPSGRIPKSGPLRSGMQGKCGGEDDEDDPLFGEDLPEEYKRDKVSTLIVLEWVSLILLVAAVICSLVIPVFRGKKLWKLQLWKWEVLVLVLICGRLVSGWGIRVIVFFVERNFLLRKRVLYFVYGLRKAVQNCIWLSLVLLTWHFLFDSRVRREADNEVLEYVTKILVCFLVGAFIWLLKTLIIKVLASSFHVKAFFDRIQESLFNQFVIETLSGPPSYEILRGKEEEEKAMAEVEMLRNAGAAVPPELTASFFPHAMSSKVSGSGPIPKSPTATNSRVSGPISLKKDEGITMDHLHRLNQKNVSAWNMKRLMKIVRHGALTTLDEQLLDTTCEDESVMQIRSEVEAKAAARKIFRNVARPRARYIYLEDLMRFMREDEAGKTMSLFEGASESERISKSSLKNWVVNAFRERRAIALTLNDTKTAVNKLHQMVNILVGVIIFIISLIILNIATSKLLFFASSQIVLVAFIFGNTCKNIFESIIFLFVVHPFDVGDRCEIEGVQMLVEEMNILTTVFLRYDNNKVVYPNSVLLMKPISNYYRSPDAGDAVEFHFHISTPPEKVALIRQRILSYIESKKEHWYPAPMFILKDIENLNLIRVALWLQHRINSQDIAERWSRRALLLEECVKVFRELDVEYRVLAGSINIRSLPPITYAKCPSNSTSATEGEKERDHIADMLRSE
ncbi:hypothetical protein Nepgr_025492 [Nepenthes gracilis]|uniref:Mechanosensitive ion channel protein n=1 Tax=Nepenthes gracilis TaxID=150966 RepID=A0AAD3T6G8_NEPGR|nr:hypothetical protein Nepgr_025492 [Nepenthes gracilis]